MALVIAGIVVVLVSFVAVAVTSYASIRVDHPRAERGAAALWMVVVVTGWLVFGYVAYTMPDGMDAMWQWAREQSGALQILMWLLLLPWVIALWIWQLPWAQWMRVALIVGLAVVTVLMSRRTPPAEQPSARRRRTSDAGGG